MDALLARFGVQAVNYAIRSGIALTSTYAIKQCSRLVKTIDDKNLRAELKSLQATLRTKVKIISPAIDLIEFRSGRGNVFLESAVPLAKSLHRDIVRLGKRLEKAAAAEEGSRLTGNAARTAEQHHAELLLIIDDIKSLLARIDRDSHLIQMAIGCSGESLSTSVPSGVSPSRLLQASALVNFGDIHFASDPTRPIQIGPAFTLSLYMLFVGHSAQKTQNDVRSPSTPLTPEHSGAGTPLKEAPYGIGEGERKPIWQEVIHKARARLCRTPFHWEFDHQRGYTPPLTDPTSRYVGVEAAITKLSRADEYAYHLEIVEDLDDGRLHDEEPQHVKPYDDVLHAGIRESIPIHQISKIFYTDTARILNIGNSDDVGGNPINPVLLLKRDANAPKPWKTTDAAADDESGLRPGEPSESESDDSGDQDDIDRQLLEESETPNSVSESTIDPLKWQLPSHLDPEWFAFEVFFEDDEEEDSSDSEDEAVGDESDGVDTMSATPKRLRAPQRSSLDAKLLAQIKSLTIGSSPVPRDSPQPSSLSDTAPGHMDSSDSFVARSPFGAITSSLSLMEMLVRLTSLQEFQQASHLSIPDPVLSFFLEESSTTGLKGEAKWKLRNEAKRRMGFDPYTDTPSK